MAPVDCHGADQGAVCSPRRSGHRALPGHRHRPGQLHRRPVLAAVGVAAGREGTAVLLRAAAAAVHDRRRHADRHRGARRPDRRRRRLDRPLHRGDPRAGPLGCALRPDARRGAEPADGRSDHRRARRRQDHPRDADALPARAARRDGGGHRPQGRRRAAGRVPDEDRAQGPRAAALVGGGRAARPVLVRRRPRSETDDGD